MMLPIITGDIIRTENIECIGRIEYHQDRVSFTIHFYSGSKLEIPEYFPPTKLEGENLKKYIENMHSNLISKLIVYRNAYHGLISNEINMKNY